MLIYFFKAKSLDTFVLTPDPINVTDVDVQPVVSGPMNIFIDSPSWIDFKILVPNGLALEMEVRYES